VQFVALDPSGASGSDTVRLAIRAVDDPPVIGVLPTLTFREDDSVTVPCSSLYSFIVDPDDSPGAIGLRFESFGHLHCIIRDGNLAVAPDANWYGRDSITVIAVDPHGLRDSATMYVAVLPENDPPMVSGIPELAFAADSTVVIFLDRYVSDVDDSLDRLSWTGRFPSGDAVSRSPKANWILRGTAPRRGDSGDRTAGTFSSRKVSADAIPETLDSFSDSLAVTIDPLTHTATFRAQKHFGADGLICLFAATDPSGGIGTDTVVVSVFPRNASPRLADVPPLQFAEDDSLFAPALAWHQFVVDKDDSISTLNWDVRGGHHTTIRRLQGGFVLRCGANWHGVDTLSLIVRDPWGGADTTALPLRVWSVPDAPTITSVPDSTYDAKSPFSYQVLVADPDVEDSVRSYLLVGPRWLHVDSTGYVSGEPDSSGRFHLAIIVHDGYMLADTQSFVLIVNGVTGVAGNHTGIPAEYSLSQNYPNPFNPSTTIEFGLPSPQIVDVQLFDVTGRVIATLLHEPRPAGFHRIPLSRTSLASGIYFYRMQAGTYSSVRKMVLLK
jgi:hypothetical protein